jgi:hypothetical protein
VQRDLDATTHRGAVDESERRHRQLTEPSHLLVAQPSDGHGLLAAGHVAETLEVGTDCEDERLAGETDCDDLACGSAGLDRIEGGSQVEQAPRAERGRLGVVETVVHRDQRHRAHAAWQRDVANLEVGDALLGGGGRQGLGGDGQVVLGRGGHQAAASVP